MKVQVTRKVIKMTYQQKEQSQQDSRVWVIGKAGKQRANIGGPAIVSLAATSLLSPTPLKFLQIYSQTNKNMGSCRHAFCLLCQRCSKASLEGEDDRPGSPGNKKPD